MASERLNSLRDEARSSVFWKAVRCEFLISMLYTFIGCGSTLDWEAGHRGAEDVRVALAFGLSAATLVQVS